jgi:hypothetical protein
MRAAHSGLAGKRKEEVMAPVTLTVLLEPRMMASLDPSSHPRLRPGDRVTWKVEGAKASQIELGFHEPRHPFGHFSKDDTLNEIGFAVVVEDQPGDFRCFVLHNHGALPWLTQDVSIPGVNIPVDPPPQGTRGGTT